MRIKQGLMAMGLTMAIAIPGVVAPTAAMAGENGDRNTTYALGAAAAYLLLSQHNKVPGMLLGLGAAYSYSRWQHDINLRHRFESYYYGYHPYYRRYGYRNIRFRGRPFFHHERRWDHEARWRFARRRGGPPPWAHAHFKHFRRFAEHWRR
ncbi:MAG: hypothetical protein M1330_01925 [Armatimonadetes bacterium]|nr:hypothetical protein [Armatimonadota bacterium]